MNLPYRVQEDYIRAWKLARIDLGDLSLRGVGIDVNYSPEDVAVCYRGIIGYSGYFPSKHTSPQADCACGFYAFPERDQALDVVRRYYQADVLLEVDLYGTVVRCEHGYRAGCQRVLCAWILPANRKNLEPADLAGALGIEVRLG